MAMKTARPEHEVLYQDLCALVAKYDHLPPKELLAIAANMVGKLVAMQDHRVMTPAQAMEIVAKNIEYGNQQVVGELLKKTGGHG